MAFVKARPGLSISNSDLSEIERRKYFKHLIFLKSKLRAGCRRLYGVGCVGNDLFIIEFHNDNNVLILSI